MTNEISKKKTKLNELPRISDRVSFIYIEKAKINRMDGGITATDTRGTVKIPVAMIGLLMLGPGTDISHRAVELMGDTGTSIIWVGERGVRNYASGRPLGHSTKLLEKQAKLVSNTRTRLRVARKMYEMRFSGEDVSRLTMQQLRSREGARVKKSYRENSAKYGVEWTRRDYKPEDFTASSLINQALSASNVCLYGLCQSIIQALGMATGLGFVHTGHDKSFVYDVADLYKAEITIPLSFQLTKNIKEDEDMGQVARLAMRDKIRELRLQERIVKDIQYLMEIDEEEIIQLDTILLWDDKDKHVKYGINYKEKD